MAEQGNGHYAGKGESEPVATTSSEKTFAQSVEDLIRRLASDPSDGAQSMLREALDMSQRFRAWQTERPSNEARVLAIRQLFDLNRRAMDYLSRGPVSVPIRHPVESGEQPAVGFVGRLIKKYASR
jgi:hypothetical protein